MSEPKRTPSAGTQSSSSFFHYQPHHRSSSTLANSSPVSGLSRSSTATGNNNFRSKNQSSAVRTFFDRPIRKDSGGGFLLESGSARSSLEQPAESTGGGTSSSVGSRHGEYGNNFRGYEPGDSGQRTGTPLSSPEEVVKEAEDAASLEVVNLALQSSSSRKKPSNRHSVAFPVRLTPLVQARESSVMGSTSLHPSLSQSSGSHGRTDSPTRSFFIPDQRRSQSMSIAGLGRNISPLNPSPPSRTSSLDAENPYPSLPLTPSPTATHFFQLQKEQSFLGQNKMRDVPYYNCKFSKATLQRVEKAKQYLELSALYKSIICMETPAAENGFLTRPPDGITGGRAYNPLKVIRNRKDRNIKRIQLDLSPWEETRAVQQWVEDLYVSVSSPGGDSCLPPPPQPSARAKKMKRPKKDWIIMPQELLADNYYMMQQEQLAREEELRYKEEEKGKATERNWSQIHNHHEKEEKWKRSSMEPGAGFSGVILTRKKRRGRMPDFNLESSPERLPVRHSRESSRRRSHKIASADYHKNLLNFHDGTGSESTAASSSSDSGDSSESELPSDDEGVMDWETDGEFERVHKKKKTRQRRKFGKIILAGKDPKKKKDKVTGEQVKYYNIDRTAKFAGRSEDPKIQSSGEYGCRSYSDEEYESAVAGKDPIKTGLPFSTTAGSGSKSSIECYNTSTRKSLDLATAVVPRIAISLGPSGKIRNSCESDNDLWGRGRRKYESEPEKRKSPAKKLFSSALRERDKERDGPEGRNSLEVEGPTRKNKPIERVKTQVEKLVDEFSRRRDKDRTGSAMSSPTSSFAGSVVSGSEDEKGRGSFTISRENALSEVEDDRVKSPMKGRSSLEVPERRPFRASHRSHHSTVFLPPPSPPKKSGEEDASTDEERQGRKSRKQDRSRLISSTFDLSREASPARSVIIESLDEKSRRLQESYLHSQPSSLPPPLPATTATRPGISRSPASWERPPPHNEHQPQTSRKCSRKDVKRARVSLLSSGIIARSLTSRNPSNPTAASPPPPASLAVLSKQFMHSATHHSQEISINTRLLAQRSHTFSSSTTASLQSQILAIHEDISNILTPLVRKIADDADELNREVTTTQTLAVKKVWDEVGVVGRMRRRRLRWVRRGGYVLLEWVVVVVMWIVWLVVVVVRCARMGVMGVIRGVRWVLWI